MQDLSARIVVVIGLVASGGCAAAQQAGLSLTEQRDIEVTNNSKTALCTLDIVNPVQVVGKNTQTETASVPAGGKQKLNYRLPGAQNWVLRFKDCGGKTMKEMPLPPKDAQKPILVTLE